jgi:hypothetical protein
VPTIHIEGIGPVHFPDEMSPEEIQATIDEHIAPAAENIAALMVPAEAPPAPPTPAAAIAEAPAAAPWPEPRRAVDLADAAAGPADRAPIEPADALAEAAGPAVAASGELQGGDGFPEEPGPAVWEGSGAPAGASLQEPEDAPGFAEPAEAAGEPEAGPVPEPETAETEPAWPAVDCEPAAAGPSAPVARPIPMAAGAGSRGAFVPPGGAAAGISMADYLKDRVQDQIDWYDRKAASAQAWFKRLSSVGILASAAGAVLSGHIEHWPEAWPSASIVLGGLNVTLTVLTGLLGLYQHQERWRNYRGTAEALKREKFLFLARAAPYDSPMAFSLLVQNVEALLAEESRGWRDYTAAAPSWGSGFSAPPAESPYQPEPYGPVANPAARGDYPPEGPAGGTYPPIPEEPGAGGPPPDRYPGP